MKYQALQKLLKKGKKLLIYTHNNPDPDCMCSALILQKLAQNFGGSADIAYGGRVTRSENRAMIELLKIKMYHIDDDDFSPDNYEIYAIVDSQKNSGNNSIPNKIFPDITIDHHNTKVKHKNFYEIYPNIGATSTILIQHYLHHKLPITKTIATSFCYALHTETKDLDRDVTAKDMRFYYKLHGYADLKILSKIRYAKKPLSYMEALQKALNSFKIDHNIISASLGEITSADAIPEIADFLITIENINFSIVTGKVEGQHIISCRTSIENLDINMGNLLSKIIGKQGKAGGHSMIAAGQFQGDPRPLIKKIITKIDDLQKRTIPKK